MTTKPDKGKPITVSEFARNMPDDKLIMIDCDWETFKTTGAELKSSPENKHYVIDNYYMSSDVGAWFFAVETGAGPFPDNPGGEYLYISIHNMYDE